MIGAEHEWNSGTCTSILSQVLSVWHRRNMELLAYNQTKFASVIQNINQELHDKGERWLHYTGIVPDNRNGFQLTSILIKSIYQLCCIQPSMICCMCVVVSKWCEFNTGIYCGSASVRLYAVLIKAAWSGIQCTWI